MCTYSEVHGTDTPLPCFIYVLAFLSTHVLCSYAFLRPSIDEIVKRYILLFGATPPECENDFVQEDDEIEPAIAAAATTAPITPNPTTD